MGKRQWRWIVIAGLTCWLIGLPTGWAQPAGSYPVFNGHDEYMQVPDTDGLIPPGTSFTIEFWARLHHHDWDQAIHWPDSGGLYIAHDRNRGWNFHYTDDGETRASRLHRWLPGRRDEWLFVQAIHDGKRKVLVLRLFDPSTGRWEEAVGELPSGPAHLTGSAFMPAHPSSRRPLAGSIADLRLWQRVRDMGEAEADMDTYLTGREPGLAAYWPLNEGEGERVREWVAGRDGQLAAGVRWQHLRGRLVDEVYREGGSVTFGPIELMDAKGSVRYQWLFNGEKIPGATDPTLTLDPLRRDHIGTYAVVLDDARDLTPLTSGTVRVALADWPMWGYDAARSEGVALDIEESLHLHWVRQLPEPKPAWRPQRDDRDKLHFDWSYTPIVMGEHVLVASMVTDSVTAYDLDSGEKRWRFYANGPVRVAPAGWQDKVYFVSDDGHLYCVDLTTGTLRWSFAAGPTAQHWLGNERIISFWAARGGPVVKEGTVYFAAGLWPLHGVFVYALDALTGRMQWVNDTLSSDYVDLPHNHAAGFGGLAPQGYLAAGEDVLVVAGGRTPPAFLDRHTGALAHAQFRARSPGGYAVHALHGGGYGPRRHWLIEERLDGVKDRIDGEIFERLVAHDRLLVTTTSGRLYCFGPDDRDPVSHPFTPVPLSAVTADRAGEAQAFVNELPPEAGYALLLGAGSGEWLHPLLLNSDLHVVVVEADPEVVRALRDELVAADLYGRRAAVLQADPATFEVQPYLFGLIVSEDGVGAGLAEPERLAYVLHRLRPYGGRAWLGVSGATCPVIAAARHVAVDQVSVVTTPTHLEARRSGPLTGAGHWTHQYADSAQRNFSPDSLVKAPLGVLWFGGPTNHAILPRHGHGPLPHVVGGRVILPGVEGVSARCVYTGRELWEQAFPGLGHPFTVLELEERFNAGYAAFIARGAGVGANVIGSPYVSGPDAIYVRYRTAIHRLAPDSGEVIDVFQLPVNPEKVGLADWGHISVYGDWLITTIEPQVFDEEVTHFSERISSLDDWTRRNWDGSSSEQVVVLDRHSGEVQWMRQARTGFRHNTLVSGNDRLFLIDGLSEQAASFLERRGQAQPARVLMALDLRTGEKQWQVDEEIFGTWLSYDAEHDWLVQGGRSGGLRMLDDEPVDRMAVHLGGTGKVVWDRRMPSYAGPLSIRKGTVYTAPLARRGQGKAFQLATGEPVQRVIESTGARSDWTYARRYGCNTHNLSTHLITFRSGYGAFYDLATDSGTGFIAGIRSGCSNNLIAADGVLNAPDYTRTCICSYAHQTSLALIPMPNDPYVEVWTRYEGAARDPARFGVNFGAPGRRVAADGIIWYDEPGTRRRHPGSLQRDKTEGELWIAASVRESDDPVVLDDLLNRRYRVRLHFAELDHTVQPGERVFDLLLNGTVVAEGIDPVAQAGGPLRGLVLDRYVDISENRLEISGQSSPGSSREPIINGIELKVMDP